MSKRACSSIFKFGSKWQPASSTAISKPSDKATSKGANTLQKAAKGCAPITSYFQTDKPVTNEQPVSTEQLQQPISTEHIVSTEQPISSEQHELPVSSKQLQQPVSTEQPITSEQHQQLISTKQSVPYEKPVLSSQTSKQPESSSLPFTPSATQLVIHPEKQSASQSNLQASLRRSGRSIAKPVVNYCDEESVQQPESSASTSQSCKKNARHFLKNLQRVVHL